MLANLTSSLTSLITSVYIHTGLIGILLAMAIESCCIPLPSEIVMPVAGILIASRTSLLGIPAGTNPFVALVLVALAGSIGCLVGSIAAYGIGYAGGRPLMLKYGKYVLISQHDADKADRFFQRWGSATAFFSRLLPVVRTYISLPAGISKMPFVKFCVYTVLGSFPWCLLLAYIGTQVGAHLDVLAPIFRDFDIVIIVVLVVLVALYIWRHIRNDRRARAELAIAEAQQAVQASQPQQWSQAQAQGQTAQQYQQSQWSNGAQQPQQPPIESQQPRQQGQGSQFQQPFPPQGPQSPQQQPWPPQTPRR